MISIDNKSATKIEIGDIAFSLKTIDGNLVCPLSESYRGFLSHKNPSVEILAQLEDNSETTSDQNATSQGTPGNGVSPANPEALVAKRPFKTDRLTITTKEGGSLENLLRILLSVLLPQKNGFLLHACGVSDGGAAHVFCGASESGKSTIANLSTGKTVLTDELVPIRKVDGRYFAYGAPFVGEFGGVTKNMRVPVKALYLLHRASHFDYQRLDPSNAMKEVFSNIFFLSKDPSLISHLLSTCAGLAETIPCYDLYFSPEESFWSYIDELT